jgi:hypothetical protein
LLRALAAWTGSAKTRQELYTLEFLTPHSREKDRDSETGRHPAPFDLFLSFPPRWQAQQDRISSHQDNLWTILISKP